MLQIGYKASAEQFGPGPLADYVVLAEELGFDSAFLSDHFQPWRHDDGHAPAALPWLGAVGARTSRIRLGTSVLTPTFRYHPAVIAQAFATLGLLFPERIILGVGTGEALNEVALGMRWPAFKERLARLDEAVTLIERLWREERVTFDGAYYRTADATVYDRPDTPMPIYIGASGPIATRFAGRRADGYITTSGKDLELYRDRLMPALAEGAAQAGRDVTAIDRMIEIKVSFDTDRQRALQDTRHWAALALTPEEKTGIDDPAELQRRADALPIDRAASRWVVSDDPAEILRRVQRYTELGFNHLVFHAPGPDQERFLRLFADQVLPELRTS